MIKFFEELFKEKPQLKVKKHRHYWSWASGSYGAYPDGWYCEICKISKEEYEINKPKKGGKYEKKKKMNQR